MNDTPIDRQGSRLKGKVTRKPTTEPLSTWIAKADVPMPAGRTLTGMEAIEFEPGYHVEGAVNTPSDLSLVNDGSAGRVVVKLNPAGMATGSGMFVYNSTTGSADTNLKSTGNVEGMFFDGSLAEVAPGVEIDCMQFPAAPGNDPQRLPSLSRSRIANFSGWGFRALDNWDQGRMDDVKIIRNGRGMFLGAAQDCKFERCGFGANSYEQFSCVASSTPMFSHCDFWAPAGGTWKGQYGIVIENGYGSRFDSCDIEVPVHINGQNNLTAVPGSSSARHRELNHQFNGCFFKVSTDVSEGFAANNNGNAAYQRTDGKYAPKGFFTVEDASGLILRDAHFCYGTIPTWTSDAIPTANLDSRPDFLFFFTSANNTGNATLQADRRGIVHLSGDFRCCHFQGKPVASSAGYPVRKPSPVFARRISNDDSKVMWPGKTPELINNLMIPDNYVVLNGATVNVDDNPLAYLALDTTAGLTRHLQDGVTTFTLPNMASPIAGFSYCVRRY